MKLSKLIECQCMWWSWDLRLRNGKHRSNISQIGAHQVIQIGIGHTPHRPPGAYSSESQFPLIFLIIINLIVDSSAGGSTNCDMDANHRRTPKDFKDRSLVEVRSLPIQPGWFWFHPMTGDCWLPASHGTKKTVTGREKVTGRPQTLCQSLSQKAWAALQLELIGQICDKSARGKDKTADLKQIQERGGNFVVVRKNRVFVQMHVSVPLS